MTDPGEYCQTNPDVYVGCYLTFEYNGTNSTGDALVGLPYNVEGHDFNGSTPTANYEGEKLADWSEIGCTFGNAWQTTTERMYLSAYHKRLSGFGPNGSDAIYQLDNNGNVTGVIELDNLLSGTNNAGTDVHDFSTDANGIIFDVPSFEPVGKTSFGDIDISGDMRTLYAMNLFDRKIYAFDVSSGNTSSVTLLNTPGSMTNFGWTTPDPCGTSEHRPFGLAWHAGKLWLGMVCEDASNAYVYSLDVSGTTFDLEITVPLDYSREQVFSLISPPDTEWFPWADNINTVPYKGGEEITRPQPMLSDLEFDPVDGAMILGFRDRWGDQTGSGYSRSTRYNYPDHPRRCRREICCECVITAELG